MPHPTPWTVQKAQNWTIKDWRSHPARPGRTRLAKPAALIPLTLALLSPAHGADRAVSGYFDTGKRDVFEDFDDEGIGDEYTYRNFQLKYEDAGFDRVNYGVSTFQKARNYKNTNDLDNHAATYKGNVAYAFPTKAPLLAGLELRNNQKRFENSPRNDYDQNVVTPFLTKFMKDLMGGALDFTLGGKYNFTDYRAMNNTERGSVRAAFAYKL